MLPARDRYRHALTATALLVAALSIAACSHVTQSDSTEAQVRALTPALQLTFEPSPAHPSAPYAVRRFTFGSEPLHDWPYGTGFAVADRTSGEVLWIYLHNGDYPPHDVHWADFDGDGSDDIFFHAGFEDVFTTHLYMNRIRSSRYGVSHFAQAYVNEEVYALVIDFDGDDRPEILAPQPFPSEDDPCAAPFHALTAAMGEWKEEYRRLAGRFAAFDVHLGTPAAEYDPLRLFSTPAISTFGPKRNSASIVRHLRLRRNLITASLPALPPPCRDRAAQVDRDLADLIQQYEKGNE